MRYRLTNASVSVGGETLLSRVNFEIKGNEKIALTGRNGAGKTTLLRLLLGELSPDRDDKNTEAPVWSARSFTAAMLRQTNMVPGEKTLEEYILSLCPEEDPYSRERYQYEMEFDRMLTGLSLSKEDKKKKLQQFSGGEQTKIALIGLLLGKPDLLLLDEPTNHLDLPSVEWLEDYLRRYENAVVIVSHDRFFLDRTAEIVYELEDRKLKRYAGNYTAYRLQKKKERELQQKKWERQQAELAHEKELIEKFKHKPNKAAFARSRKSMIARMELVEKPAEEEVHFFDQPLEPEVIGDKWVVEADKLKIGYDHPLLSLSLRIRRGQKIGILGENGSGKTTFLKTVIGDLPSLSGSCRIGARINPGYFDQQSGELISEKSVVEHFHDQYPALTEKEARQILGAWLFGGKKASVRVSDLSGGEKARLVLCEMMTARPNFLILDEPTNHMDIPARETLESAFRAYTGTILFVSHDRYFTEQVADSLLVFQGEEAFYYPFGYSHYLDHCRKKTGGGISALVLAENEALVAGLRAVPKAERRLREIDTDTAYVDWKLGQKTRELEAVQEVYEKSLYWYDEQLWEDNEKSWTQICIEWYDLYLELE